MIPSCAAVALLSDVSETISRLVNAAEGTAQNSFSQDTNLIGSDSMIVVKAGGAQCGLACMHGMFHQECMIQQQLIGLHSMQVRQQCHSHQHICVTVCFSCCCSQASHQEGQTYTQDDV